MNEKLEKREVMNQMPRKLQIIFFIGGFITYILKSFIDVPEFVAGIGAGLIICSALLSVYSRSGGLDDLKACKRKLFKIDKNS